MSGLSAQSQVLLRNQEILAQGKWLLVNPTDEDIFIQLADYDLNGYHQYWQPYQACLAKGVKAQQTFAASFEQDESFDGVVIYISKAKQQNAMLLANVAAKLKPQGQLLLVGENKGGIKSAGKQLEKYGIVQKIDSARHCALYGAQLANQAAEFSLRDWQQVLDIHVAGLHFSIVTLPGVFSYEHLDPATHMLLENLQPIPSGELLDFACGAGPIGCYLGLKNTNSCITMSDVNALALYCAEQSAKLNQINAKVIASDGLRDINGRFKAIYTNPPFHTGIKTDYQITQAFIQEAGKRLVRNGSLTLVANRFLPYQELLEAQFCDVHVKAQNSKFSLYQCA